VNAVAIELLDFLSDSSNPATHSPDNDHICCELHFAFCFSSILVLSWKNIYTLLLKRQSYKTFDHIQQVNAVAVELLEFVSDFGNPSAPIPAAVVACVPKIVSGDAGSPDEPFFITPEEINETIINGLAEPIEGEPDLDVPKSLIPAEELEEKVRTRRPEFVTLQRAENEEGFGAMRSYDEVTGVVQRRLSNGIRVNYKVRKQVQSS
jgi:hypothetical protein